MGKIERMPLLIYPKFMFTLVEMCNYSMVIRVSFMAQKLGKEARKGVNIKNEKSNF